MKNRPMINGEKEREKRNLSSRVSRANEASVVNGMQRCAKRVVSGEWLDLKSAFGINVLSQFEGFNAADLSREYINVADYCAASSVLHCTDAWNYLGRACNALSAGMLAETAHFLYYSELRSAISILASSGIVVSDSQSFALMQQGTVEFVLSNKGTHVLVWELFNAWSKLPRGWDIVGEVVTVQRQSLKAWLEARRIGGNSDSTMEGFLLGWGLDLDAVSNDKSRRNIASYQPTGLNHNDLHQSTKWTREMLVKVGELVEPDVLPGSFLKIDVALLSQALTIVGGLASNLDKTDPIEAEPDEEVLTREEPTRTELRAFLSGMLNGTAIEGSSSDNLLEALVASRGSLIEAALSNPAPAYPVKQEDIEGMFGRALILSRLATGYVSRNQKAASVDLADMIPWADNVGLSLGYWGPAKERPDPFLDMWRDIEDELEVLREDVYGDLNKLHFLHSNHSSEILIVTGLTRAALWSLSA